MPDSWPVLTTPTRPDAFAVFLQAHRRAAGITQAQLANDIGVATMTISRWERGLQRPEGSTLGAVSRLCARLGVPAAEAWRALGLNPPAAATEPTEPALIEAMELLKRAEKLPAGALNLLVMSLRTTLEALEHREAKPRTKRSA